MARQITVGDVVVRKGTKEPQMQVTKVAKIPSSRDVKVWCDWQEGGKARTEGFPASDLEHAKR
ncbi:MAG TPA: hypothetical protein VMT51_09005 [Dongiaceae bacterium]|nr:hypothetical protein [Dongiaceae bacterium]